ncbi:PLP-dependent aminotransferase family protein [Orlajensenia leifsoniae]|uniref:PLP-dependent aminotransferase family protein n=1 Tax=Orlajensenia leifsoniae TaxID=2561933 RepID=A0A4Y9QT23_9MICO|nr:PLP-dependent aminotransferase family protein [Leifsonia flava]TFV95290.1 PLP-dependent aminotransferase family protein [Leifsonia flava]
MSESWANSGLDLHLDLGRTRRAASVEAAIRAAILDGRLAPGSRLPPSRSLAADLGIARNSIADVYGRLVAEGWLESRVGSGTWVSDRRVIAPERSRVGTDSAFALDLRGGLSDASGFPRSEWSAATRRALARADAVSFGYGDPAGHESLRTSLATYLGRARGVWAEPDRVVVMHGFGELLAVVGRALVARGSRRIGVEAYGHERHRRILSAAGLDVVPLGIDAEGADVTRLDQLGIDALLLTPAHQFPTGVPLSPSRRVEVVRWAERSNGLVIEDDYDGEFRFDGRTIGALQALAPERIVYAGTASKSLAPAVGLAWAVVPPDLRAGVLEQRLLLGSSVDSLAQLSLAEFIDGNQYDRHLRSLRSMYRERRRHLEEVLGRRLPGFAVTGMAAGLHCLLELPPGVEEADVEREAAERGLRVEGMARYLAPGAAPSAVRALVLGFGAPPPHRYDEALGIIAEAVVAATRSPR